MPDYAENLTPQTELDKPKAPVETFFLRRDRGGRAAHEKDRQDNDAIWDELDFNQVADDVAARFGISEEDEL